MNSAEVATHEHIAMVRKLLGGFAIEMIRRGDVHDASKFHPVEMGPLEDMQSIIDRLGPAEYGSLEYRARTDILAPMIAHHRANNSHHPEFYENGVSGMDLFDLVEMFFDWRAANVERDGGAPMGLGYSCERYGITGPLKEILFNTAERLGYPVSRIAE